MQLIQAWFNNTTFCFLWTAFVDLLKLLLEDICWVNAVKITKKIVGKKKAKREKSLQLWNVLYIAT